jgi:hypothetical protein
MLLELKRPKMPLSKAVRNFDVSFGDKGLKKKILIEAYFEDN